MSERQRYLSASADVADARSVVLGLPWEGGISWRGGAHAAPAAIRAASESIESYSPTLRADLADLMLADAGDLALEGLEPSQAIETVASGVGDLLARGLFVLNVGGDHSVSVGTTRGARRVFPDLAHLVYDAHLDLRAAYDGSELSHACGTRHMALAGPTVVLGVRSGAREEFAEADKLLAGWSEGVALSPSLRSALEGRRVLVSVDLDVLDPSEFPGTGNPEPAGASYRDLRASLLALGDLRVVAVDLVELSPNLDPSGVSAVAAAELAREILLSRR